MPLLLAGCFNQASRGTHRAKPPKVNSIALPFKGNCSRRVASFFTPGTLTKRSKKRPSIKNTTSVAASIAAGAHEYNNDQQELKTEEIDHGGRRAGRTPGGSGHGNRARLQPNAATKSAATKSTKTKVKQGGKGLLSHQHWLSLKSITQRQTHPFFQSDRNCSLLYPEDKNQHQ